MAIQADLTLPSGITVASAYIRLNSIEGLANRQPDGIDQPNALARFRAYVSEDAFRSGAFAIEGFEREVAFVPTLDADLIPGAYAAIKAEPGFAEAANC
jgi:hypothetical protein